MRWWRYEGWVVVRTLYVNDRSLYSMRSVILSQCREPRMGVVWHDLCALTTACAREFWICWTKLEASYLKLKKVVADMVVGSVQPWVGMSP